VAKSPRPLHWLGRVSLVLAIVAALAGVAGIVLATADLFTWGSAAGWAAVGCSAAAVVLGIIAIVGRFAPGAGVAGLTLGVLANPLVLTAALDVIGR
jgi:hypothetical protein